MNGEPVGALDCAPRAWSRPGDAEAERDGPAGLDEYLAVDGGAFAPGVGADDDPELPNASCKRSRKSASSRPLEGRTW